MLPVLVTVKVSVTVSPAFADSGAVPVASSVIAASASW